MDTDDHIIITISICLSLYTGVEFEIFLSDNYNLQMGRGEGEVANGVSGCREVVRLLLILQQNRSLLDLPILNE